MPALTGDLVYGVIVQVPAMAFVLGDRTSGCRWRDSGREVTIARIAASHISGHNNDCLPLRK